MAHPVRATLAEVLLRRSAEPRMIDAARSEKRAIDRSSPLVRRFASEIIWKGRVNDRIGPGDRVTLLEPHPDAGRAGIVRLVDVGGAVVQLLGPRRCFTWAGEPSLAKEDLRDPAR